MAYLVGVSSQEHLVNLFPVQVIVSKHPVPLVTTATDMKLWRQVSFKASGNPAHARTGVILQLERGQVRQ